MLLVISAVAVGFPVVVAQTENPLTAEVTLSAFLWTFIGALLFILGGWLKKSPPESFKGYKAIQTLIVALFVSLISIAFNIPPAEALTQLEQWIAAFIQLATSTGLIALIEFWRLAIWRRLHPQQAQTTDTGSPNP